MNPVAVAARGKGARGAARRASVIGRRYGLTTRSMERAVGRFIDVLREFGCSPTFPVTAAALQRSPGVLERYGPEIELAIHGYYHVDHTRLTAEVQAEHLRRAQRLWESRGISLAGFRAPYLRANAGTLDAIRESGVRYDASRAIAFPVDERLHTAAYQRAVEFEMAVSSDEVPSLPRRENGVLRLPYTLPDDEAIVDRLAVPRGQAPEVWLRVLDAAYERGEMVGLGLHPERIDQCEPALRAVLAASRARRPAVWIARLDEIAAWWTARATASIEVVPLGEGAFEVRVSGPSTVRIVTRGVEVVGGAAPWYGAEEVVAGDRVTVRSSVAPLVSVSRRTAQDVDAFLVEHGYPFVRVDRSGGGVYIDQPSFGVADEKRLLDMLEASPEPLVRLARWPDGARCALSITGDIDALTIWDYGLRVIGR